MGRRTEGPSGRRPAVRGPLTVRAAEADDGEALTSFRCSAGRWFQDEVEEFINAELPSRLLFLGTHVLLFGVGPEIVAIGAHQPGTLTIAEEPGRCEAAHLLVLALTGRLHAARLANGARLSDHVMLTLLQHALQTHRVEVAFAIVAVENQRALTMCERNGLSSQSLIDRRYARATGRFASAR